MKKTLTRILSLILACITLFGVMSIPASAASAYAENTVSSVKVDTSGGKFYIVKTDNAKLKTKASWYGSTYATYTKGSLILSTGTSNGYIKTKLGGTTYYIHADSVKKCGSSTSLSIDYVTKSNAPFRTGPAEKSSCAYRQAKGTTFCLAGGLTNSAGNYWEIAYKNGKLYFVYSGNCKRVCTFVTLKVSGAANTVDIRRSVQLTASYAPSAVKNGVTWTSSNPAVATVNASGLVTGVSAGTAVITASDKVIPGLSASVTITVTPRVQLDVPLLKQTDSRWGHKYYGGSSADIYHYGCALCSLNMCFNYLYKQDKTPDVFDDSLSFTAGGCVVWQSVEDLMGYTCHRYNGLAEVYQQLKQGRPVIICAANSKNMHYVTITSYNGDGYDFSAKLFGINDSGDNRTTLDQYFKDYPNPKSLIY